MDGNGTATGEKTKGGARSPFRRMTKNIGWGLGSRGFTSLVSVAYLAVAARALGPEAFGAFALTLTYGQLVANFVQFQSWKGVIRYGALHVASNRPERLARLFGFTATLDFGSALLGALIAIVGVPLVAPLLDWAPGEQQSAAIFAGVLLLTTGATPAGILRLFDRFDLIAYNDAIGPVIRLGGAVFAWVTGGGIHTFLAIWAAAAVAQAAILWVAALSIRRSRISFGRSPFKQATEENERIWSFMLQTNLSNSISLFWMQLGTLAVGTVAGAAEAGAFRLARGLSKGILRPVQPVTLALYPELSRLVADDDHALLRKVVTRSTLVAAVLALLVVAFMGLAGREVLRLVAGEGFEFAYPFLFMLSVASAINLVGFAFEPVQNAHGRAWNVLRAKLVAAVVYVGLLAVLLPRFGGQGAAIAAIICSLMIFGQLGYSTARLLRKPNPLVSATNEAI